jgi:hypothetical protein
VPEFDQPLIVHVGQDLGGSVGARVVDDHHLDRAGKVDVEDPLEHGLHGPGLVVHRH